MAVTIVFENGVGNPMDKTTHSYTANSGNDAVLSFTKTDAAYKSPADISRELQTLGNHYLVLPAKSFAEQQSGATKEPLYAVGALQAPQTERNQDLIQSKPGFTLNT